MDPTDPATLPVGKESYSVTCQEDYPAKRPCVCNGGGGGGDRGSQTDKHLPPSTFTG
jgi:hypothetical protein